MEDKQLEMLTQHFSATNTTGISMLKPMWEIHTKEHNTQRALISIMEGFTQLGEVLFHTNPTTNLFTISYNKTMNGIQVVFEITYNNQNKVDFNYFKDKALSVNYSITPVQEPQTIETLLEENKRLKEEIERLKSIF